jgi:tetratricopeptide (TPR) repeat protein
LGLAEDSSDIYNNKGISLFSIGKINESIQTFDQAIELNPNSADSWYNKGIALSTLKRYNESIQAFDKAIELNPQYYAADAEPQNLSNLNITIYEPQNGETTVSATPIIRGTFSGDLPKDKHIWVLVNPVDAPGLWYPQGEDNIDDLIKGGGTWAWKILLGGDPGKKSEFNIAVVLVDSETDTEFLDWLDRGKVTKRFPGWKLPDTARILDKITVTRKAE